MSDSLVAASIAVEQALVARNPRGMAAVRSALQPGYLLKAAQLLNNAGEHILICTGFPVANTFETDGPAGAIALYRLCKTLGKKPLLLAGKPLIDALGDEFESCGLAAFDLEQAALEAETFYRTHQADLLIVIERPGHAEDGRYYNIRRVDISDEVRPFEPYVAQAPCPVIAIGDGGNEIGMGSAGAILHTLNIEPAVSTCDALIVADVSNWGAYGLVAMAQWLVGDAPLATLDPRALLEQLSAAGSVDGVTHENTVTEDGLPSSECESLLSEIRAILSEYTANTCLETQP